MNRLLTEGRRAFLRRVSGIQRGADCARYEPLLSALADGEASEEDLAALRPHMRTCLSCRAALREFRAAPERVASVLPPVALAATGGGPLRSLLESALGAAGDKTVAMGERLHAAAELAAGQKLAVVAASAAALAGGGTGDRRVRESPWSAARGADRAGAFEGFDGRRLHATGATAPAAGFCGPGRAWLRRGRRTGYGGIRTGSASTPAGSGRGV